MCEILWQAGVPADVLQLLAGPGSVVGARLVRDPRVALIAFTGSKEVGLDIIGAAGQVPDGQGFLKKVVCEMGGKNAIIVDDRPTWTRPSRACGSRPSAIAARNARLAAA